MDVYARTHDILKSFKAASVFLHSTLSLFRSEQYSVVFHFFFVPYKIHQPATDHSISHYILCSHIFERNTFSLVNLEMSCLLTNWRTKRLSICHAFMSKFMFPFSLFLFRIHTDTLSFCVFFSFFSSVGIVILSWPKWCRYSCFGFFFVFVQHFFPYTLLTMRAYELVVDARWNWIHSSNSNECYFPL